MLVKELIESLKAFNPDAEVYAMEAKTGEWQEVMDAEQEYSNVVTLGCEANEEGIKYVISVMGTKNDTWFNSKLLTEEYDSEAEAENERQLTRDLLGLEDKKLLVTKFKKDQKWVKQCLVGG